MSEAYEKYTLEEWRKFIAEMAEQVEDRRYLSKIYSLLYYQAKREAERGRNECPTS